MSSEHSPSSTSPTREKIQARETELTALGINPDDLCLVFNSTTDMWLGTFWRLGTNPALKNVLQVSVFRQFEPTSGRIQTSTLITKPALNPGKEGIENLIGSPQIRVRGLDETSQLRLLDLAVPQYRDISQEALGPSRIVAPPLGFKA
jgi:hypothetical protein